MSTERLDWEVSVNARQCLPSAAPVVSDNSSARPRRDEGQLVDGMVDCRGPRSGMVASGQDDDRGSHCTTVSVGGEACRGAHVEQAPPSADYAAFR